MPSHGMIDGLAPGVAAFVRWAGRGAVGVLGVMCIQCAVADTIYQWRDSAGVTHFTDNPAKVPVENRQEGFRELSSPRVARVTSKARVSGVASNGRDIWLNKCKTCHHLNSGGWKGEKLGLVSFIINPKSGFPFSNEDVIQSFRYALNGRTSNMQAIEMSDRELHDLVEYATNLLQ